jgi:hypothetical protein
MPATPWAILLCKFNDDSSAAIYPRQRFNEIFTSAGNGKFNMIDYFRDMSHGQLDLSGSKVFPSPDKGWYTLTQKQSDYLGWNTPTYGRGALQVWAREAAKANQDELTGFFNIVVVMNTPTDLFGGTGGVATDDGRNPNNGMSSLSPSLLGQEMGHGYGLDHARIEGSVADYMDPFDIMSTASAIMAPHPVYTERDVRGRSVFLIGPGLNAATMHAFGWLDASRVWQAGSSPFTGTIQVRPLHRKDLPGFLCARIGNLFIEFRMNELWDAGFSDPVVLIHDYFDGHSYLQIADDGNGFLTKGSTFSQGDVSNQPGPFHGAGLQITVTDIDAGSRTASLNVKSWVDQRPEVGPGTILGGVANDGGGWVILNGKVFKVPPRSPLLNILEQMVEAQQSQNLNHFQARGLAQQRAYAAISELAAAQAKRALSIRQPSQQALRSRSEETAYGRTPGG